ncbi:MAG: glycosyltransferase family 4 protein [Vicinamibacterales bacterium]
MLSANPYGPLVVIGNPRTPFVQRPAQYWRRQGIDTIIVTARLGVPGGQLEDGTPVLDAAADVPPAVREELGLVGELLGGLEAELDVLAAAQHGAAVSAWGEDKPLPSIVPVVADAVAISRTVRRLHPRAVFGQEVFCYGLATALCHGVPRALMIWGGDIDIFAESNPLNLALTRYALRSVETVFAGSETVASKARERFGVPAGRVHPFSFGIDRSRFHRPGPAERSRIRQGLGLPADAAVVLNLRRLDPLWGADVVVAAGLRLLRERPDAALVLPGGIGNDERCETTRRLFEAAGLLDRVRILSGDLSLDRYAELLKAADVGLALAQWPEPRSMSVTQGMACGLPLVLADHPVWRDVQALGGDADLVPPADVDAVVGAVASLLADARRRDTLVNAGLAYVARHEDEARELDRLRRLVENQPGEALTRPA